MSAKEYFVAARRSAHPHGAGSASPDWHQMVINTPGVTVSGGTANQLKVHAEDSAIAQLRQVLGQGFLIEPALVRGSIGSGQEEPPDDT